MDVAVARLVFDSADQGFRVLAAAGGNPGAFERFGGRSLIRSERLFQGQSTERNRCPLFLGRARKTDRPRDARGTKLFQDCGGRKPALGASPSGKRSIGGKIPNSLPEKRKSQPVGPVPIAPAFHRLIQKGI